MGYADILRGVDGIELEHLPSASHTIYYPSGGDTRDGCVSAADSASSFKTQPLDRTTSPSDGVEQA